MATELETKIILSAEDKTKSAFASASNSIERMQPAFRKMATIGVASFTAVAGAVALTLNAYAESQAQLQVVDSVINTFSKSTLKGFGGSMEKAQKDIREFGARMQKMGGIADEVAAQGVSKLTQITGDYTKAQKAAMIAADLSIFKNIDYGTAVDIVGKVLSGNTGILGRYGIQLEKGATIEQAMAALAGKTAGQYAASGKTLVGQTKILKESIGDLQENIGQALAPALTKILLIITPLIEKFVSWAEKNPDLLAKIVLVAGGVTLLVAGLGFLGMAIPIVVTWIGFLSTALMFLAANPIGLVIVAVGALVTAGVLLYKNWDKVSQYLKDTWDGIKMIFKSNIDWIMSKLQPLIDLWNKVKGIGSSSAQTAVQSTTAMSTPSMLTRQETAVSSTPVYNFNFAGDVYDQNNFQKMLKGSMSDMLSTKKALPF